MKVISHRGNINGCIPEKENSPEYINLAISYDYEVEIDLWVLDEKLYLGHDFAQYPIKVDWLTDRKSKLLVHCKNLEAATYLSNVKNAPAYFCHTQDDYSLISNGLVWVHNISLPVNKRTIIPLLDLDAIKTYQKYDVYGICSDYVSYFPTLILSNL